MPYTSRELIKIIEADGWYEVRCRGSHHQYKHETKHGTVTIKHPEKDVKEGTFRSILRQAKITLNNERNSK